MPVVATCRGAVSWQLRRRATRIFDIERQLRLRLRVVRHRVGLPAALSTWACALGQWRRLSAQPGFDPVVDLEYPEVLVDALLAVAAEAVLNMDKPRSPFYDSQRVLRSDLMARHADGADVFEETESDLLAHLQACAHDFDTVFN